MPIRLAFALLASVVAFAPPATAQETEKRKPIVVADVDGVTLTDLDIEDHLDKSHGEGTWRDLPKDKLIEARKDVLEQHIRVLVIEAELKRLGIVVSRQERKAKIAEMRRELAKQGKHLPDVLRRANSNLWFLERAMGGTIGLFKIVDKQVNDEQVKAFFESHQMQFQPRWKVRQILVLTVDRTTRNELGLEAKQKAKAQIIAAAKAIKPDGSNFADCVARYSNGPRARTGGELPWYAPSNKLPGPFKKAMVALETEGQRSKIFRTPFGWHIIQLVRKYTPRWQDARQPCIQAIQESKMKQVLADAKIKRFSFETGKELAPPKKGAKKGKLPAHLQLPEKQGK